MSPFEVMAWAEWLRHVASENERIAHAEQHHRYMGRMPRTEPTEPSEPSVFTDIIAQTARRVYARELQTPRQWAAHLREHHADPTTQAEIDLWRQASEECLRRLNASS